MTKKAQQEEVFTYRVRPDGDGRYFVGAKYNQDGEEEEVVTQRHMSEPDAEKELRSIVTGRDVIAGPRLHSVDADDNRHVVVETSAPEEAKRHGATLRYVSDAPESELTPADQAVEEGAVADIQNPEERPENEQKLVDRVQEKVAAREAKEKKS